MIRGTTTLIAHIGYPTDTFKSPMIYNPYFESAGVDAVVVPMGVKADDFAAFVPPLFRLTNIRGALITMPHKVAAVALLNDVSTAVKVAGSCNAILLRSDGSLFGDMFDGEGFVRGIQRKGRALKGSRVLVIGSGGVGSAIAASLAKAEIAAIGLFDTRSDSATELAKRLRTHYPHLEITMGKNDPAGYDVVVNATPLGMNPGDPLPTDISRIAPSTFVGEVVMKQEITPFLQAVRARGCDTQVGTDMLFEQIPAYLDFFGFPAATPEELRAAAKLSY
jgi:shikimate dehydrogenase